MTNVMSSIEINNKKNQMKLKTYSYCSHQLKGEKYQDDQARLRASVCHKT